MAALLPPRLRDQAASHSRHQRARASTFHNENGTRPLFVTGEDLIREDEVVTDVEVELHENRMDELDVEGVLAFAEHVVLNARRLWSEYDLNRRRHLQKVLFSSGVHFDGEGFGTPFSMLLQATKSLNKIELFISREGGNGHNLRSCSCVHGVPKGRDLEHRLRPTRIL